MWVTHLSSKRKSINRTSYNTSTVLTLPFSSQWRTIREDGVIPFMYTIVKPEADGKLSITVYRKPTHTDQYLQWDSHHHLSAKFSAIHTLSHSTPTVCDNPELLHKEKTHFRNALAQCKYPKWTLDKVQRRLNKHSSEAPDVANNQSTTGAQPDTKEVKTKGHTVIPYTKVSLKVSRRSVVGMAYRPIPKVVIPSETYYSPQSTKTLWSAKVGPFNVVTSLVMINA